MLKTIIKRDGTEEAFDPKKVNQWVLWASEELRERIDWSSIVMNTIRKCGEKVESQKLQEYLIKECIQTKLWPYNLMAGRLYAAVTRKEIFGDTIPPVKEQHANMASKGYMVTLNYTDEEYSEIEKMIDHERDFHMAYFQVKHIRKKYALADRINDKQFETPQFVFMRMAMALAEVYEGEVKLKHVKNWYDHFSFARINAPTPNYMNLGTGHDGYASCCLYTADDTAQSLAIGDHIAYTMTYMSAGIGGFINSRSLGDPVRGGLILHQGKGPYYTAVAGAVKANLQGGRGGACTQYISVFDPEIETIVMTQNPRTPVDKRNRDIHFSVMWNRLFAKRVAKEEQIFHFNKFTAPDLMELFFTDKQDEFEALYNKYDADTTFPKKYTDARKLMFTIWEQRNEVATLYDMQIDEVNRHTPYLDPIYSSNLCVSGDTIVTAKEGNFTIKDKVDEVVHIWNGEEYSETTIRKTGENQKLIEIKLGIDYSIQCTPYHKFYISKDGQEEIEVRASELTYGDRLSSFNTPDGKELILSVTNIFDVPGLHDTYCFNEPKRHRGMFNGILTGNCAEITQPTKPYQHMVDLYKTEGEESEVSTCSLGGLVVTNIHTDEECESAAYYTLLMIDRCIHMSHYELPHVGFTAKNRLNAGVGILGLAYHLARLNLKYDTAAGLAEIHRVCERHSYFLIKASLKLGKELGNAPWMHKTKWPTGWTPVKTYKKSVDQLVEPKYNYDWEDLSAEIIDNRGIRNSSIVSHMPTESSSKASGVPNSVYALRSSALKKTDAGIALDWVAPDNDLIDEQYQIAWDIDTVDMVKAYAVMQKFTDQAISADFYRDRVKMPVIKSTELIDEFLALAKYGVKTQYYQNSFTVKVADLENTVAPVEEVAATEQTDERGCPGGFCTL